MLNIRTEGRRRIRISVNRNRKDCPQRYSLRPTYFQFGQFFRLGACMQER